MNRASRTFRLTLSPAGMSVLIDAHCRLIRTTRGLLAWGTTLHIALHHLSDQPTAILIRDWSTFGDRGLEGQLVHYLGAPIGLQALATDIVRRIRDATPGDPCPRRGAIYLIALAHLAMAEEEALQAAYRRVLN